MNRPKLLVTGASGFLGAWVCLAARERWDPVGVAGSRLPELEGTRITTCDLTDREAVEALFERERPQAVVHAAALADPNRCQQEKTRSRMVNVEASRTIAELCARGGLPLVFTSTDLVFDGARSFYKEADKPSPISLYGEHKVEAERAVLGRWDKASVARLALLYGPARGTGRSVLSPMIQAMRRGERLTLFTDELRTPLYVEDAAAGILMLLEAGTRGLVHLAGPTRLSRYDFGRLLANFVQGREGVEAKLAACRRKDVPMSAPRPADVSLDISRARALGFRPLTPGEGLDAALKLLVD